MLWGSARRSPACCWHRRLDQWGAAKRGLRQLLGACLVSADCSGRLSNLRARSQAKTFARFLRRTDAAANYTNPVQLFDPACGTCTYLLFAQASREALTIDPVDEQIGCDLAVLHAYGPKLVWTVETQAHAEHITSAGPLAELVSA